MTNKQPTKEEQIKALMEHKALDLTQRYTNRRVLDDDAYAQVFTVKRKEIEDFFKDGFQIKDVIPNEQKERDGFYALPEGSGYRVYEQYDGFRANEENVQVEDRVWDMYVDFLLRTSGTGLEFP